MMEGGGGCCIARYVGGGGGGYEYVDTSRMHRIMLRFRPIAPKPVTAGGGGSSSGGSSPDLSDVTSKPAQGRKRRAGNNSSSSSNKRPSKARNKISNNNTTPTTATAPDDNSGSKRTKAVMGNSEQHQGDYVATTLPLLPEAPDGWKQHQPISPSGDFSLERVGPTTARKKAKGDETTSDDDGTSKRVVGSCVTVECVAEDAWVDADWLGRTDEERRARLGMDTCPGFISDGLGRVTWTNDAYRKMLDDESSSTVVWLVTKWRTPVTAAAVGWRRAFSCHVRVQYLRRSSITVPCDVWGMEGGGFAWRLDLQAALSLGCYKW